jgi:hypothetical protein
MHHVKEKMIGLLTLAVLMATSAGCTSTPVAEIVLDKNSVRLEGWFHAHGEWIVSATKDIEDPADKPLNQRCIALVNGTGSNRNDFAALDGKRVVVTGYVADYYDIPIGPSRVDQIIERRYYKDEAVFDTCRRQLVFIAKSIRLSNP